MGIKWEEFEQWGFDSVHDAAKEYVKAVKKGMFEFVDIVLDEEIGAYLKLNKDGKLVCHVFWAFSDDDYFTNIDLTEWLIDDIEQEYMNDCDAAYHRRLIEALRSLADKAEKKLNECEAKK